MPSRKSPRKGSLQYWPRKRAAKFLPRVNWDIVNSKKPLKGFICYKAGMVSAFVKDNTDHSMTKGKKIAIPATILECPTMKIYSVRFYKDGVVAKEILVENHDKELKGVVRTHKGKSLDKIENINPTDYDNIKVICYSQVKKTGIKKTPDLSELGIAGTVEEKFAFVKEHMHKEITVFDVFDKGVTVDFRGLTKGKGLSGPVSRFGITLKSHKSEKGRRRPGSLGPWHPARVTFRAPMAGQLGMFTRISYNNKVIEIGKAEDSKKLNHLKNFGDVRTDYVVVQGSVQGPAKRQLLMTAPMRETKKQAKKKYEFIELR